MKINQKIRKGISKTIALVVICVILIVALAAAYMFIQTPKTPETPTTPEKIHLTLWAWGFGSPVGLKEALKPWEEENNAIVDVENVGGSSTQYEKMVAAIRAGEGGPDVAEINFPDLGAFWSIDALLNLSDYGALDLKSQYPAWMFQPWILGPNENTIYGMPMEPGNPVAFGYRADIFEKYNLDIPRTWADFMRVAGELHLANSSIYISDFQPRYLEIGFKQVGGQWFKVHGDEWEVVVNSTQNKRVVEFWADLLKRDLVKYVPWFTTEWFNDYVEGKLAGMAYMDYWMWFVVEGPMGATSGKWRVSPVLQWSATSFVGSCTGSTTWAVMKNTKHPELAASLAKWMSTSPVFYSLDPGGAFPSNKVVRESDVFINSDIYKKYWGNVTFYGGQNIFPVYAQCADSVDPSVQVYGPYYSHSAGTLLPNIVKRAYEGEIPWESVLDVLAAEITEYIVSQGGKIYSP